ncbi:hypothetical protein DRJ54_05400 [Candidatus Acetothermia bacterium]|nr:MAG: hypothetical protein DRJ54_05400 [Candidatus Acetothermia bacterium]
MVRPPTSPYSGRHFRSALYWGTVGGGPSLENGRAGDLIRAVRARLGWSQWNLAEHLGVHWVTVSRWESGRVEPRAECLRELVPLFLEVTFQQVRSLIEGGERPFSVPTNYVLGYDLQEVRGAVQDYVQASLEAGFLVCFIGRSVRGRMALSKRWRLPPEVLSHPSFRYLEAEEVLFRGGNFDVSQINWVGREIEAEALRQGYRHVRWIVDFGPLFERGLDWGKAISAGYNAASVFSSQEVSEGLGLFPAPGELNGPYQVCLLCLHPWLLGAKGFVRNPFHEDKLLCWARGQLMLSLSR